MHIVSKPQLSLGEKLQLACKILFTFPPKLAWLSAKLLYFAGTHGLSFQKYWSCAVVRVLFSLSGRQFQYLTPTSAEAYKAWIEGKRAKSQDPAILERLVVDIQQVPGRRANLLWLGNRKIAKRVVLFFHGGGYVLPMLPGYGTLCWNSFVLPALESRSTELAVAILSYDLAPGSKFPGQLGDAAAALQMLIDAGLQPKDIIIGGDSAGGNLTMLLLHHLVHPHPQIPPVALNGPLAAAFVASPWLNLTVETPSALRNERADMLSMDIMRSLTKEVIDDDVIAKMNNSNETDSWITRPFGVDESWLCHLANIIPKLYITAGAEEILLDNSLELAQKLKNVNTSIDVQLDVQDGEAHDWIVFEANVSEIGSATKRMREWIRSVAW